MAFLKDIQDKIVLGRWRFLNLKTLVSQNTSQLAIDENGNLGTVPSNSGEITDLEGRVGDVENRLENITPTIESAVQPSDLDNYATVKALNTGLNSKVDLVQFQDELNTKVNAVEGLQLSQESFTTEEKTKLAGLESPKFKGQFLSLADLTSADVGEEGGYAYVDGGEGGTVDLYIWDAVNSLWEIVAGEPTAETPASIKSKYESNPDTNAFTTALKTAYDNTVSWITTNGANILNHLSNKSNPHEVTAAQLGLGDVDNTKDVDKPISNPTKNYVDSFVGKAWIPDYANMETTNRITSSGGSWTSDRTGFVYVLSRGYNSGIYNTSVVYINSKEVGRVWVEATSGTGTARSGSFTNIFPVKPGDFIRVYGNLEVKCLFIPGIWA